MLRLCVAQRHRINVPADRNPQAVLAQISPILLVGSRITAPLSNCLRLRFNNWACLQGSRSIFDLLLKYASFASKLILDKIYNTYKSDLSHKVTYDKEVLRLMTKRARADKKSSGLVETMETINSSHYSSYNAYDMSTVTQRCSFSTVHSDGHQKCNIRIVR